LITQKLVKIPIKTNKKIQKKQKKCLNAAREQGDKLRLILIYLLTQEEANSEARTSAGDSLLETANLNHLGQVLRNLDLLAPPAPSTSPNSSSISAFLGTDSQKYSM
jgi:hypothetical protein